MRLAASRLDDCTLVLTRAFDADPLRLWTAHVDPAWIRQWMPAPPGWEMTRCTSLAEPGGLMHLEWSNGMGGSFALTGEVLEADAPHHLLHVERLHLPDPGPETVVETAISPRGTGSLLTLTLTLPDAAGLETLIAGDTLAAMEVGYARLDAILADRA